MNHYHGSYRKYYITVLKLQKQKLQMLTGFIAMAIYYTIYSKLNQQVTKECPFCIGIWFDVIHPKIRIENTNVIDIVLYTLYDYSAV